MRTARVGLVLAGLAALAYGAAGLVESTNARELRSAVTWLAGGVLVHDAVLAPATVVGAALLCAVVPGRVRPYVQSGLVITGAVLLVAAPFVSGRGYSPDNPSALPLDYRSGLVAVVAAVWAGVAVTFTVRLVAARRRRPTLGAPEAPRSPGKPPDGPPTRRGRRTARSTGRRGLRRSPARSRAPSRRRASP